MRKLLILNLILSLAFLFGCPTKQTEPSQPSPQQKPATTSSSQGERKCSYPKVSSPQEAVNAIATCAKIMGYNVTVGVQDVNENNIPDIIIIWKSPITSDEEWGNAVVFASFMGALTGLQASFKTDLIVIKLGEDILFAKINDLASCFANENLTDQQRTQCIVDAWRKVDTQQQKKEQKKDDSGWK